MKYCDGSMDRKLVFRIHHELVSQPTEDNSIRMNNNAIMVPQK